MIIDSSQVGMSSSRSYSSCSYAQRASIITTAAQAATLDFSDEAKSLMQQLDENQDALKKQQEEQLKKRMEENMRGAGKRLYETSRANGFSVDTKESIALQAMRKMLESLRRAQGLKVKDTFNELPKLPQQSAPRSPQFSIGGLSGNATPLSVASPGGTTWTKTTVQSSFFAEQENTAFTANGMVRTADGREIGFGITLEMSRSFCAKYESFTQENYIMTDPLVINLDSNIGSLSDQKFLFDLDSDGKEEEISFAGKGSGFLALDKNGDGMINDGNELFGTKSGNGFADLAMYDEDGNGWIDEADSVFKDLRVWMKGDDGKDILLNLKDAGVGAIYLGSTGTQFHLNNDQNQTNGVIQQTGIYLKENGGVGTIQHIDLAL